MTTDDNVKGNWGIVDVDIDLDVKVDDKVVVVDV